MDNTPSQPTRALPGVGDLIQETWSLYTKNWHTLFATSINFIYFGLAWFIAGLIAHFVPGAEFLFGLVGLAWFVGLLWLNNRLILKILSLHDAKEPLPAHEEGSQAWKLFWPVAWVAILTALAVMGGLILLIIPGLYLGTALAFSQIITIDQGKRGVAALATSRDLIKGRWWAVFGRLLAWQLLIGIVMAVVNSILGRILGLAVGPQITPTGSTNPIFFGSNFFLTNILYAATFPLIITYTLKMYRALEKTR